MGRERMFTVFWFGGPKVRDHWEDVSIGGRIALRWTLRRQASIRRIGFGWLKIGSIGGLLCAR
jgi:hypothetical protein